MHDLRPNHDPILLIFCGCAGLFGTVSLLLGNMIGSMIVPNHDWIADTVSDLAAGRYEFIQDIALYGYAFALITCAIGAAHLHLDGTRWSVGICSLAILAMCVVIIGARNEYGDNDSEGVVIHIYLVYALGFLFSVLFLAMGRGLGKLSETYARISYGCAAFWILGAPVFFFLPTGIDGLYERGLGVITMVWVGTFSWMLYSAGRGKIYIPPRS